MKKRKRLLVGILALTLCLSGMIVPRTVDAEETESETQTESLLTDETATEDKKESPIETTETDDTVVSELPEDSIVVRRMDSDDGIQTYSIGDYGVNHGMYRLYSAMMIVSELNDAPFLEAHSTMILNCLKEYTGKQPIVQHKMEGTQ